MTDEFKTPPGLSESVPANNQKIIEVYNKLRGGQINVNKSYQRKLVWKNAHKFNFIDTILRNFPFPEVYLAPGSLDQVKLVLIDEIVDGQQRLTTIRDYIEGKDVFALPKIPIKKFSELSSEEKNVFLNYEVSIRYLKNVSPEQVKEIFQRINKTDYALNAAERLNAQWGESEFVCFAKQIVDPEFRLDTTEFIIDDNTKKILHEFFHGDNDDEEGVFSENDKLRMLAYQYIMTLIATLNEQEYFHRNEKLSSYIEAFNDNFPPAPALLARLLKVVNFVNSMAMSRHSRWFKKANLFTLIIELDAYDTDRIEPLSLAKILEDFDHRASLNEIGLEEQKLSVDEIKYLANSREGVNQKHIRKSRGDFVAKLLDSAQKIDSPPKKNTLT